MSAATAVRVGILGYPGKFGANLVDTELLPPIQDPTSTSIPPCGSISVFSEMASAQFGHRALSLKTNSTGPFRPKTSANIQSKGSSAFVGRQCSRRDMLLRFADVFGTNRNERDARPGE